MAISWTKKFSSSDDGMVPTGAMLGTMQDDIDTGTAGVLATPGATDALKIVHVKSDYSGYELVAEVPMAAGGTGSDLSTGTAGYAVCSQGTAGNMSLQPVKSAVAVTFAADSAAQTVYTIVPVEGVISEAYIATALAGRGAAFTVRAGSAGNVLASLTTTTATTEGGVSTMTLGTVAVTTGSSIGITRAAQGSTGGATVSVVIIKTP